MSEYGSNPGEAQLALSGGLSPAHELSADERLSRFRQTVDYLGATGVDEYERAHYRYVSQEMSEPSSLGGILDKYLTNFTTLVPEKAALRLVQSIKALELNRAAELGSDPPFPEGLNDPRAWRKVYAPVIKNPSYQDDFLVNLLMNVASNISERGKLLKAVLLLNDRPGPVSVLDVGSSLNHNLKRLAIFDTMDMAYEEVKITERDPVSGSEVSNERTLAQQRIFNEEVINRYGFRLAPSLGIDVWDVDDEGYFRNWAKSNSFYMSELLDPRKVDLFNGLCEAEPPEVDFKNIDVTDQTEARTVDGTFDVAYVSTMLYQLPHDKVQKILDALPQFVKDDGMAVVQDFIEFGPNGTFKLYERPQWRGNYGVWVMDMKQRERGFQKYFSVDMARARQIILEPALGELAVAQELGLVPRAYEDAR